MTVAEDLDRLAQRCSHPEVKQDIRVAAGRLRRQAEVLHFEADQNPLMRPILKAATAVVLSIVANQLSPIAESAAGEIWSELSAAQEEVSAASTLLLAVADGQPLFGLDVRAKDQTGFVWWTHSIHLPLPGRVQVPGTDRARLVALTGTYGPWLVCDA